MRRLFIIPLLALLCSCASFRTPKFEVFVDSITSENIPELNSYVLLPGDPNIPPDDLHFQEYARFLERALAVDGFNRVDNPETADLAIALHYGIGDPQELSYTKTLPVWGKTGETSHTNANVSVLGNTGTVSGTTTTTPKYGITGFSQQQRSYVAYHRYAVVSAYNLKKYRDTGEEEVLWETSMNSTGTSGDLRRVFPILAAAGVIYYGRNSGQSRKITLKEHDQIVISVREGHQNQQEKKLEGEPSFKLR